MWQELLSALALVLVLEGLVPFWNPQALRRMQQLLAEMDDRSLRLTGLLSMLAGLLLLYLVR